MLLSVLGDSREDGLPAEMLESLEDDLDGGLGDGQDSLDEGLSSLEPGRPGGYICEGTGDIRLGGTCTSPPPLSFAC